jgi:prolyl oligopeptidase
MNTAPDFRSFANDPAIDTLHGFEVEDPFRWLEDQNSPATRAFISNERRVFEDYLHQHSELRSRINRRVTELLSTPTVDLPVPDGSGGLVFLKREAGEERKAIYHQDRTGQERMLLSTSELTADNFASLSIVQVDATGRYLVFGLRLGGEDVQEVGFYDLERQRLLGDRLPKGFYRGLVFNRELDGFHYVHEETAGPYELRRSVRWHRLGTDRKQDSEIFHAGDGVGCRLVLQRADDGSALGYLLVTLEALPQSRFLIHDRPFNRAPREVVRLSGEAFAARFTASTLEANTTYQAPQGRIVRISCANPKPCAWEEIVSETGERIVSWNRWGGCLVVHCTGGVRKLTRNYSDCGRLIRTVEYPENRTCVIGCIDESRHCLFYSYSNITSPPAIFMVDLQTGEHRLWWQQPSSARRTNIEIHDLEYRAKDGTAIPITLVHAEGIDQPRPVLLNAYGGAGVSMTPKFSVLLTVLVEAGFICATAHVRGGGEKGPEWHLAAVKERKQTSVDDLVAGAQWLIKSGYTTPDQLAVAGQSEGALLALCAMMQEVRLFRAVMALGPICDLTRFHLFGVARGFVVELGSPEDPSQFAALYRLSPYHRIQAATHYPAVLIISGDRDKRCDGLHARKMIARLRSSAGPGHPILLDYTETRGHKPVLPLSERIRTLTNRIIFLLAETASQPTEEPGI